MQQRLNYAKAAHGAYKALLGVEQYLHECGLEIPLLHLIKLRASQINGCAYCLDMHWKDLRAAGENEQRLYSLALRAPLRERTSQPNHNRSQKARKNALH